MDFGEYVRGGTAPLSGKPKIPPALNPTVLSRPKTRAVDNDLQDTNVDLKVNRMKTGSNNTTNLSPEQTTDEILLNEKEIARINLNDWNEKIDNNAAAKRAPSRGKKSKDPTRKDNSLMSGLSAYTQNMPAIVLNTNRKSHKGPSASPRTAKESKNISQINELRAAYGTDIPVGKPASPPGKTRGSKASTAEAPPPLSIKPLDGLNRANLDTRGAPSSGNRKNTTDTASVGSSVNSSKEIETPERGRELLSNRSTVSSSSEISHSPTRKLKKNNSLLKVSFNSKHSDESNFDGNNIDQLSTSPENGDTTERNRTRSHSGTGPSPTDNVLVPVDVFLNEVIVTGTEIQNRKKEIKAQSATSSGNNKTPSNNSADVSNRPRNLAQPASNLMSFSISDYTIGPVDTPRDELFADLNDHEIPEDEIVPIYDGTDEERIHQKQHSYIADTSPSNKARLSLQDPKTASYSFARNSAEEVETEEHHEEFEDTEHQEELSPRPQSRKLYLGSEKPLPRDKSNSKVPRSAGARYGAYSPIKGGVELPPAEIGPKTGGSPRSKKTQFRKLSSHGDLADWMDESNPDLRPPSRQSTAFPVHLSNMPGNDRCSPLALVQPATMNKMEIITTEPDHDIAESPASVRSSRQPMTVNTEPRTVKKVVTNIKNEEEKKGPSNVVPSNNAVATNSENVSAYNVRPPSRQKVAAQHLFDNEHPMPAATLHDNPSIETITIVSRRSSRTESASANRKLDSSSGDVYLPSDGNSTVRLRTANGRRPTTTRGKPATSSAYDYEYDDYNDDGFAALDPNDNFAPFPITVNYGNNFEQSNNTMAGNVNALSNDSRIRQSAGPQKIFVEDFPVDHRPVSYDNNTNIMGYGNQSKPRKVNHISPKNATNKELTITLKDPEPPHHRPKSVTAIPGHSPYQGSAGIKNSAKSPALNYDMKQEEHTLRSKSANNYAGHHRLYNPVHSNDVNTTAAVNGSSGVGGNPPYLPSKPTKANPNPPTTSQGARTRAWGDQPDPRNIPRAQNVFGMEADTGWTSPALLGNPFSSTTINDNLIIQDDDEMTILTEESGGYVMDGSLSIQSFNIETSLDEDFLKLFAPGR